MRGLSPSNQREREETPRARILPGHNRLYVCWDCALDKGKQRCACGVRSYDDLRLFFMVLRGRVFAK